MAMVRPYKNLIENGSVHFRSLFQSPFQTHFLYPIHTMFRIG